MSDIPQTFQSDDPELLRRLERIRNNFHRLDSELTELEQIVLDDEYLNGLTRGSQDLIRKPR